MDISLHILILRCSSQWKSLLIYRHFYIPITNYCLGWKILHFPFTVKIVYFSRAHFSVFKASATKSLTMSSWYFILIYELSIVDAFELNRLVRPLWLEILVIFSFMKNEWFSKPNLIEIKAYNRFFRFSGNRLNNYLSKYQNVYI